MSHYTMIYKNGERMLDFLVLFKLVVTRSVETSFLRGLQYANVSLTHSLRCRHCSELVGSNESARASPTPSWNSNRACCHVGIVTEPDAMLE